MNNLFKIDINLENILKVLKAVTKVLLAFALTSFVYLILTYGFVTYILQMYFANVPAQ